MSREVERASVQMHPEQQPDRRSLQTKRSGSESDDPVDRFVGQPEISDHVIVQDANAAGRDRSHRELLLTGNTKLANDEDVQGRIERLRHLEGHRHAATRQREHKNIGPIGVVLQ